MNQARAPHPCTGGLRLSQRVTQLHPKPLIPWPGGKRRLAKTILPLFPEHSCYVEAFAGGAGLFFSRPEPVKVEVLNDINNDLITLYRCVAHHLDEFVRQFRWSLASRKMFEWAQLQDPRTLTDIQRAARFFYLQRLCFGAKVDGRTFGYATTSSHSFSLLRIEEELSAVHLRLSDVYLESLPWDDCLRRYDRQHTLTYLDPPYWETTGYGVPFGLEQYERMAELLTQLQGKALLSINDHPEMRRIFGRFPVVETKLKYTVGRHGREQDRGELIYRINC